MKKLLGLCAVIALLFTCSGCGNNDPEQVSFNLAEDQLRSICELSVYECYYHNVAKYSDSIAFWSEAKKTFMEYDSIVNIGIDASKVSMTVKGNDVTIAMPDVSPDSDSMVFIDGDSLLGNAADFFGLTNQAEAEKKALAQAKGALKDKCVKNKDLLAQAKQTAKELIANYVNNVGDAMGQKYNIIWKDA